MDERSLGGGGGTVTISHYTSFCVRRGGDIFDAMIFVMRTFHLKMLCFTGLRGGP